MVWMTVSPPRRCVCHIVSHGRRGREDRLVYAHFMEDVPNKTADIREKFETIKSEWTGSIELKLASENMLDNLFKERLETRDFLFHGDGKLLVETSTWRRRWISGT